jgi:hypothetical protein
MDTEQCYGCGAEAPPAQKIVNDQVVTVREHPIVGVLNRADLEAGAPHLANPLEGSAFVGVPVCAACHQDPAHRSARALKCHFFERGKQGVVGLVMAGSATIGG